MAIVRDNLYASTVLMLSTVAMTLKTAHDNKGRFTSGPGGHAAAKTADEVGKAAHAAASKAHKEAAAAHAAEAAKHLGEGGDRAKATYHAAESNKHANRAHALAKMEKAAKKAPAAPAAPPAPSAPAKPTPAPKPKAPKPAAPAPTAISKPKIHVEESAFDHDAASAWSFKMTPAERAAVDFYKGPGYADLNGGLRRGKGAAETPWSGAHDPAKLDGHRTALDSALAKSSAPRDLRATRVLGAGIDPSSFKAGGTLKDHGYMSTSVGHSTFEPERGKTVAVMNIKIPKGTPGGFIRDKSTSMVTENEFLLPRGSTLRFNKVEVRDGVHHIEAEVVHGG